MFKKLKGFLQSLSNKPSIKMDKILLGNIEIEVILKDIKNVHLSVFPPNGRVRIAAPLRMNLDNIRIYAISKLGWIKKQQARFKNQNREAPRDYITKESHYYFGKRYQLKIIEHDAPPTVELKHNHIVMSVRPNTTKEKKQIILDDWYRQKLKETIPPIIAEWEKTMKVKVNEFGLKKMRTRWGTCNRDAKRIWLNLELVKKPIQCLEYIVVHEMVHLLERGHNDRFKALMNKFLPTWKSVKEELNRLPVGGLGWGY